MTEHEHDAAAAGTTSPQASRLSGLADHPAPAAEPLPTLSAVYSRVWWIPLLRGLVLVLLGLLLLIQPLVGTTAAVVALFAVFLVADAVVALVQALTSRWQPGRVWWVVQAVTDLVFAAFVLLWPGATALVLYYVVASWAIVLGVVTIITGVNLARVREAHWPWVTAGGIVGVLFGLVLVARPPDGGTALSLVVAALGLYAFVVGVSGVVSAFAARAVVAEIDAALAGRSPALEAARARSAALAAAKASTRSTARAKKTSARSADAEKPDAEKPDVARAAAAETAAADEPPATHAADAPSADPERSEP